MRLPRLLAALLVAITLTDVLTLPGPFRIQTSDDPHFADPTFDLPA